MRKLKTKTVPCLIMLLGGAVTLLITYLNHYPSKETIKILFISLLACYFVGTIVKTALDQIEVPDEEAISGEESDDVLEAEGESEDEMNEESEMEVLGEEAAFMEEDRDFVLDENLEENVFGDYEEETLEPRDEFDDYFDDSTILN